MGEVGVEGLIGREIEQRKGAVVFALVASGGGDAVALMGEPGVGCQRTGRWHGQGDGGVGIERKKRMREPLEVHWLVAVVGDVTCAAHATAREFDPTSESTLVPGSGVSGAKLQRLGGADQMPDAGLDEGDLTVDAAQAADAWSEASRVRRCWMRSARP